MTGQQLTVRPKPDAAVERALGESMVEVPFAPATVEQAQASTLMAELQAAGYNSRDYT